MIDKENKNLKVKVSVVIIILIVLLLAIMIFFNRFNYMVNDGNLNGGMIENGVLPGYTEGEIEEILQRKADESMFSFEINARPFFKDGNSEGNLRIANPPYNNYAIAVEISLDSNNKIVFKSKKLNPNQYIESAKLIKRLKAGEYNATARIKAYSIEDDELIGESSAKIIIGVEN